jgi:hypothetical protein
MSANADVRSLSEAWPSDRDARFALRSGHRRVTTAGPKSAMCGSRTPLMLCGAARYLNPLPDQFGLRRNGGSPAIREHGSGGQT